MIFLSVSKKTIYLCDIIITILRRQKPTELERHGGKKDEGFETKKVRQFPLSFFCLPFRMILRRFNHQ